MKYLGVFIGMTCLLEACHPLQMKIEGEVEMQEGEYIYLGEILDENNKRFNLIDSAVVVGGKFSFGRDSVLPELLYLGDKSGEGDFFFAEPGTIRMKAVKKNHRETTWEVQGGKIDVLYRHFLQEKYKVRNQKTIDSLENLFYAARDRKGQVEMARIKRESQPFYDRARVAEETLVNEFIEQNKENIFGIYLYYNYKFRRKKFSDFKMIEKERQNVAGFGSQAMSTVYKKKIDRQLDLCAGCAIGAVAPEITGTDTLGNPLKLSDLRGQYVIVDFWNSYCHWCREETPWLRKAMETFRDKNFTILGVSNDRSRDLWMHAIREDKSCWDHLLLRNGDPVMTTYCIKGIPHIILVGPDGKILAKELRHEKLTEVPAKYLP